MKEVVEGKMYLIPIDEILSLRVKPKPPFDEDWIVVERRGGTDGVKWAINSGGRCVLNKQGHWEYEPFPSNRDEEFLSRCRYDSLEEAWQAAMSWEPEQEVASL